MNRPEDLIFPNDTIRLLKNTLADLCNVYELEATNDVVAEYNAAIWRYINSTNDQSPLTHVINSVFGGQTALVWYKPEDPEVVRSASTRIRDGRTNFFESKNIVPAEDMEDDRAYIVGACRVTLAGEPVELVRVRAKSGRIRQTDGIDVSWRPTISTATMILSPNRGYMELRASSGVIPKILDRIEPLLDIPITRLRPELIAPFAEDVEAVADQLGGRAVKTDSKPEAFLRRISNEQIDAVIGILDAVSEVIREPGSVNLEEFIEETRDRLIGDVDLTSVPLSVLMLAGFNHIGLTADEGRDVRDGALYKMMRESMQHHGGHIQFPVIEEDGSTKWHTIRLGATTNSIAFHTKATEAAIKRVRDVLLFQDPSAQEAS